MSERERQVMKKLKEVVDKQRDEIRARDRELGLKNEDVEAVSGSPRPVPALGASGPLAPFCPSVGSGRRGPEAAASGPTLGRVCAAPGGNVALPAP